MTLRCDERARVPFALVGVVLLVSAAAYTGVLATRDPVAPATDRERALQRSQTAAHLALEQATLAASRTAGARPLTTPADTPMGRVLDGTDPFERYLGLLVYRHARVAFRNATARTPGGSVTPTLPAVRSPTAARRAIRRTTVEPVDAGRRLRVTIDDVPYEVRADGDVVTTHRSTVSVVVASPILALHDRTTRLQARLDADLTAPGLGRRLTARLWATSQARGLAQYGGAPIANVLPTRHVELQTNAAALALQRQTFGRADPESRAALAWATARVGLHDGAAALTLGRDHWSERVLDSPAAATPAAAEAAPTPPDAPTRTVDPNRTTDRALVDVLDGTEPSLTDALAAAYTIDARLHAQSRVQRVETSRVGVRPDDAILADTTRTETWTVQRGTDAPISAPPDAHVAATNAYRVVETERVVRVWRTTSGTARTATTTRTVHRVTLGVVTRYDPDIVPPRPVRDTPELDRLRSAAVDEVLGSPANRRTLARRVASGQVSSRRYRVSIPVPATVRDRARDAVLRTHERTRALAVTAPRPTDGTGVGTAALARYLADNRSRLLDAPGRYEGPASVATTAARATYLDAVAASLAADESKTRAAMAGLRTALDERGVTLPRVRPVSTVNRSSSAVSISTTPAYLPVTAVTPEMAAVDATYHPLATRNVNLFTVPAGDVGDAVADTVVPDGGESVDLGVAARTLATSRDFALPANETLAADRRELTRNVEDANAHVLDRQTAVLTRHTGLSEGAAATLVETTAAGYTSPASLALALTNGTIADTLARRAARRLGTDRRVLAARLRVAARTARAEPAGRVSETTVHAAGDATRAVAREGVRRLAERGTERAVEAAKRRAFTKAMAGLPAGLPVAPVPGSWYATVNVWVVDVRGAYHRVEARSTVTDPGLGDGLSYVRETESVRLDVDNDGTRERLGRVEPVAFSVQTAILVAVPPGPRGVGDTDGNADERSVGWPGPPAAQPSRHDETQTTPPTIGSP